MSTEVTPEIGPLRSYALLMEGKQTLGRNSNWYGGPIAGSAVNLSVV